MSRNSRGCRLKASARIELESNAVGTPATTLQERHDENIEEQKKDSDNFINEINNYNGKVSPKPEEAVQQSNEHLPEIAPESDVHMSCDKLPDLPVAERFCAKGTEHNCR